MKPCNTYYFYPEQPSRFSVSIKHRLFILLFLLSGTVTGYCQQNDGLIAAAANKSLANTMPSREEEDDYEEITITLNVQRLGSIEIPALVYGQTVYLSVKDMFDFLKIRNFPSEDFGSISGFFINPQSKYLIDKKTNAITYLSKIYLLNANELITTPAALYLKSDYYGKIFGLNCIFDFHNLAVTMITAIELPAIREMQQEQMHRNIGQLKGLRLADTTIQRAFSFFKLGMADWAITSTQQNKSKTSSRINLGIGAMLAGGELNLSLNYNSDYKLKPNEQYYQWRYVNNDHSALRQVTAGKIFVQSIASIYTSVKGLQITNTPSTFRQSFGTYTISNTTDPLWIVELYVNNILVNYTKADASGFYSFEVPVIYGNSSVKLRFYGPWGEERTSEKYISIPFNFIPFHHFEYNITSGIVDDKQKGLYSKASLNYGLGRHITVGGGMEYLSTVTSGKLMPFVNVSMSLLQHILISGEHSYGVRSKGIISYRTAANLQAELSYTRYVKGQTAVLNNNLDEKKLVVSMPVRGKKFTAFSRFTLNQFILPDGQFYYSKFKTKYTSAELLISAVVLKVGSNFTTYAVFDRPGTRIVYSNLALTFRLPAGFRVTPQVQYEYGRKKISMLKAEVEKSISSRGLVNLAYEKDYGADRIKVNAITLGVRYNFSFVQTSFFVRQSGHSVISTQAARGSLMYDAGTNYLGAGNMNVVGKGGIIIAPFLDINSNGLRDPGEPKVSGLNVRICGGRLEKDIRDTLIRVSGLEAYTACFIELDKNSFDNIAWQIKKGTISVMVEPNVFKTIEVPVYVVGEVSGYVMQENKGENKGLGRIIINIINGNAVLVSRTLTEDDGFFNIIGLPPGKYAATIDQVQINKLQLVATPAINFEILPKREGDVKDGLKFILKPDKAG